MPTAAAPNPLPVKPPPGDDVAAPRAAPAPAPIPVPIRALRPRRGSVSVMLRIADFSMLRSPMLSRNRIADSDTDRKKTECFTPSVSTIPILWSTFSRCRFSQEVCASRMLEAEENVRTHSSARALRMANTSLIQFVGIAQVLYSNAGGTKIFILRASRRKLRAAAIQCVRARDAQTAAPSRRSRLDGYKGPGCRGRLLRRLQQPASYCAGGCD